MGEKKKTSTFKKLKKKKRARQVNKQLFNDFFQVQIITTYMWFTKLKTQIIQMFLSKTI